MSDLLIRNISIHLKRQLQERARKHRRSLSQEAKELLEGALSQPDNRRKLGTELLNMIRPEDRGDDLMFEIRGELPEPPDFK